MEIFHFGGIQRSVTEKLACLFFFFQNIISQTNNPFSDRTAMEGKAQSFPLWVCSYLTTEKYVQPKSWGLVFIQWEC